MKLREYFLCAKKTKITTLFNNFFSSLSVFYACSWTILPMSLLPFWALNVVVPLLSMQGQKALGFHLKYLNLCSEDEQRSYGFGTTRGWVINDRSFLFGRTNRLIVNWIVIAYWIIHPSLILKLFQTWMTDFLLNSILSYILWKICFYPYSGVKVSVTWSFSNHSNKLICCLRNILKTIVLCFYFSVFFLLRDYLY